MKVLNLYAGICGNRKLWDDVADIEVTAIEYDESIARAYMDRFPTDTVVIGDAKQYLLDHYREFDFIWASPPCQSHSRIVDSKYKRENYNAKLPDMSLYQIILFLHGHARDKKYVVENVIPHYDPLIKPSAEIDRHLYWSNFNISGIRQSKEYIIKDVTKKDAPMPLDGYGIKDQRQVIRNQVNAEVGKHILECSIGSVKPKQGGLFDFCTEATS